MSHDETQPHQPAAANRLAGDLGEQGHGTCRNPVLPSDYHDPCVIRIGLDYYLAAPTFGSYPRGKS